MFRVEIAMVIPVRQKSVLPFFYCILRVASELGEYAPDEIL